MMDGRHGIAEIATGIRNQFDEVWETGNCPGLAFTLTGEVNHRSPDACLRRFLAEVGLIPMMAGESDGNPD